MRTSTTRISGLLLASMLVAGVGSATAQTAAPAAAAAASGAMPVPALEPDPKDSNADRARSQPLNNAPFWRGVRESGHEPGYTSLPGAEKGVLIQPFVQYPGSRVTNAGDAWRQVRNHWLLPYGGALLLIVVAALGLFYFGKGPLGHEHPASGRRIERFTPFERAAHWSNAIAFVILAISGIVMAFGKFFLLPVIGATLFGWLTYALKTAHNFVGPLFVVSLLVVFVTFLRDNWPARSDLVWVLKAGGALGEAPSHRFNAGEKAVFWGGVLLLGSIVTGSGLVLDKLIPGLAYLRGDMQVAHMIHAAAAMLMMALLLGHIYMGTIGTRGAFNAMRTGYVEEAWAHEHHALWYRDVQAGKVPAQRSAAGTAGTAAAPVVAGPANLSGERT